MTQQFDAMIGAFAAAGEWFATTVREVSDAGTSLETTALGVWTLRDLAGHTSRALTTVASYLGPAASASALTTADYYRMVRSGRADPEEVAERGRQAGRDLGDDVAGTVDAIMARVLPVVAARNADACVETPVGEWTLGAYLPTRVFELAVHTADLRRAAGLVGVAPAEVNREALRVLAVLVEQASGEVAGELLAALTGRSSLPSGFSLL